MNPIYQVNDPRFRDLVHGTAHLERVATGCRWTEGPVWFPAQDLLICSDIPNERMLRITGDGQVSTFRARSNFSNGNTRDREGRLVSCLHGGRCVERTEPDGTRTVIADAFEGKPLNSPNDVVVKSDGSIWFTDPTYGIMGDYEGYPATPEQPVHGVYRVDPDGTIARVISDFTQPNGLAFSPDERRLYVAESGSSHDDSVPSVIRAFDLGAEGLGDLKDAGVLCTVDAGLPDGFRVDREGNIWCSAADGVQVFASDGTLLGKILVPEVTANLTFGGARGNRLYITATTSVYAVYVNTGAAGWPKG